MSKFAVAYFDGVCIDDDDLEVATFDDADDVEEFIEENPSYDIKNIVAFDGDDVDLWTIQRSNVSIDFKKTLHSS